jgi:hypothetical protein
VPDAPPVQVFRYRAAGRVLEGHARMVENNSTGRRAAHANAPPTHERLTSIALYIIDMRFNYTGMMRNTLKKYVKSYTLSLS